MEKYMTLTEYMIKAFSIGILKDESSGKWYVDPWWETNLYEAGYRYNDYINVNCWEMMKAECDRRNLNTSKLEMLAEWLLDEVNTSVDPAITKAQNDLTNDIMEYLKNKYNVSDKNSEVSMDSLLNFSKKGNDTN